MTSKHCLNCGKKLVDTFCSGCGQKADTHRITFKNFIYHDLLHGTFHIEKGILFTTKQALIRPGKAALEYIAGKRKPYYNVFLLIILVIGLMLTIRHLYDWVTDNNLESLKDTAHLNEASKKLNAIFSQKSKIILFLFVPISALNSFILFRRKKLNLSEHLILAGMILLGMLLISTIGHVVFFINLLVQVNTAFLSYLITFAILAYIAFGYTNAFAIEYSKWEITFKIILYYLMFCLELFLLLFFLVAYATNWEFGEVVITPFG